MIIYYIFGEDRFPRNKTGEDLDNKLKKPFKDYFHTNKGIDIAYKNQYETWFNCKKYLYLKLNDSEYEWHNKKQMVIKYD
jgi:hypothetical protein